MKLTIVTFYKLKMLMSDKLLLMAMIIIPLFLTLVTGYSLKYEKLNIIPIAFVDQDGTEYSRILLERLQKKEGIIIENTTAQNAADMVKNNKAEAAFIVKKGFMESIAGDNSSGTIDLIKSPASFSVDFVKELVAGEVIRFTGNHMAADWVKDKYEELGHPVSDELTQEIIKHSDSMWGTEVVMPVNYQEIEGKTVKDVERNSIATAAAASTGMIVFFIMFYILFSSGWLVEERQNGTLKRLTTGPGAIGVSFTGSIIALFILGLFQLVLFYSVYRLAFGLELFANKGAYLVLGAYLLVVISISMLLASVLKTPAQLQAGAPVFALLTGFAGGCFWNIIEVPDKIKKISMLTPQGWTLDTINKLQANSGMDNVILIPVIILLSLSLILLPLSYIIIRVQIRN
jgi:ABC-type multidrug transport system permease subunit